MIELIFGGADIMTIYDGGGGGGGSVSGVTRRGERESEWSVGMCARSC